MNQIEQDLLVLHAKFHKWVRDSKREYSLNVKADDSYSYVQADTQGAFDAFCAGIVIGMEDYKNHEPKKVLIKPATQVGPNTAASVARTDSETQALELYRAHLNEFLTTKFPEPDFRVYGVGDRFYASLDESQKLFILNKFVAGICLETTDLVNERKFIDHFRHKYLFEQNAKRVRQLARYETTPATKQG
jgi:hypothetical protein